MANGNWDDDWRIDLEQDNPKLMERFANCKATAHDLKIIAKIMWRYNRSGHTKEECLDRTIMWITDWNNQVGLIPDDDDYKKILEFMGD